MKKIVILIISLTFTLACASIKNQTYKKVTYKTVTPKSSSIAHEKKKYTFLLPIGFKINKEDFNPEFKEVVYTYNDNTKFYITDNIFSGSPLNGNNKMNNGIKSIIRKSISDSIYMKGKQKDGRFWKENVLNDIVIGYLNVPKEKRKEFDKAILSLKKIK